ncbi:hypothetical protein [Kitasatospora griseola]|uniref:hypothetical protein n=1 Tax=Kitasatospora griseola TaxID=2064 RepID=UPI00343F2989
MPNDPSPRRRRPAPRPLPAAEDSVLDDLLGVLGRQLGEPAEPSGPSKGRSIKSVTVEFEQRRGVHDMAGDSGYSLASNWFTQLLAQLAIAKRITKSELCVFLYIAGGQIKGTGIAAYTQQQIADGLNEKAEEASAPKITRSTVSRALRALCDYGWVEKTGNAAYGLNIRLWFRGNSDQQKALLAEQRTEDPDAFPNYIGPDGAQALRSEGEPEQARQERTG